MTYEELQAENARLKATENIFDPPSALNAGGCCVMPTDEEIRLFEISIRAREADGMGTCITIEPAGWEKDNVSQVYLTGIQGRDGCLSLSDAKFIMNAYDDVPFLLKCVSALKEPANFGWQCYQDRCEGALIEQSVRDREVKELQAENARLKALTEWRPIDEAPKDGTDIEEYQDSDKEAANQ